MKLLEELYNLAAAWMPASLALATIAAALLEWLKARGIWDVKSLDERLQPLPSGIFVALCLAGLAVREGLVWWQVLTVSLADGLFAGQVLTLGVYHGAKRLGASNTKKRLSRLAPVALVLLALGCAASLEETRLAGLDPQARAATAPASERCVSLDGQRRTWGAIGKGAGVLAGAEGLATIPVDDQRARIGLAAGTVAAGTVAVVGIWVSEDAGEAWVRECSQ